jgi:putative peptidoglycan lipid II flippase
MTKKPFVSTALWVAFGRTGGILVPFLIAMLFGASPATDAFFFAYSIVFALFTIFSHIFESSLVPFIVKHREKPEDALAFILGALKVCLPAGFIITLAVAAGLSFFLKQGTSIHPETARLIPRLYLEMLPALLMAMLVAAYQGFFYAHKLFWFPAVSPILRAAMMALFFVLFRDSMGIHSLTLGFGAGEALRFTAAHFVWKQTAAVRLNVKAAPLRAIFEFFHQAVFQILALVAINITPLTDSWAAAPLGAGKISLLNYADRIMQIPYLLFFYSVTQIFLSYWSESYLKQEAGDFFKHIEAEMRRVFTGALILVALLLVSASPLIRIVFMRSSLTEEQLQLLTVLIRWLAFGFLPGIMRVLYARLFIVIRESRFFFIQSWIELAVKVSLNLLLASIFGIAGIAAATAVTYTLTAVWFYRHLQRCKEAHLRKAAG